MIPLGPFLWIARKAVKHVFERPAVSTLAVLTPVMRGYDFQAHMRQLSKLTGCFMPALKPNHATFEPRRNGVPYVTVLFHHGEKISIVMFSKIMFPYNRIPSAVLSMIDGLTPPSNAFTLDTADDPRQGSFVVAGGRQPHDSLTPQAFSEITDEMMLLLGLVDAWIEEQGHARRSFRKPRRLIRDSPIPFSEVSCISQK